MSVLGQTSVKNQGNLDSIKRVTWIQLNKSIELIGLFKKYFIKELKILILSSLMIIDDDGDFNTLVKFVLEHDTDWKILTALDGEEGVTLAQLQQPDVILLDIVMPNLNGLDVYHLLKSNQTTCSIPIIFVTAMVRMEQIIKAQITEDIEVITKPFNIMTLANRVTNVCDRYLVTN